MGAHANTISENPGKAKDPKELAVVQGLGFVRGRFWLVMAVSIALLAPCWWHRRIEAGDLASHTYNAWLAQLISRGQAPGLYMVWPWTNVLVDVALVRLSSALGFAVAASITASACVLIFFWGAFALVAAATRRPPWFLTPAIAMIAYGWSFQMGFMNYCLSLGLAFLGVALFWRGRRADWAIGLVLTALVLLAHVVGLAWLVGAAVYVILAERLHGWARWMLFAAALLAIYAAHVYVPHHYRTDSPVSWHFRYFTGADQLVLYGTRYNILRRSALLFAACCFILGIVRDRGKFELWRALRTPLELWATVLFATAMLWGQIFFPQHGAGFGLIATRLSSITAVLGLCILGCVCPRKWHLTGWVLSMVVFFAWMYQDTGVLNQMEEQVEMLVSKLPYGRRVVQTIFARPGSRVVASHIVDRACIGRCFTYSNYEAPEKKFRIRVKPGSPIVTDSADAGEAMEEGKYVVRPEDLPMTEIYQCDPKNLTRLCSRELTAGEKNGRVGYHPPGF